MVRAGWYDDPVGAQDLRWWDGSRWTGHVRDDPTGTPPQVAARPPQASPPPPQASPPPPQVAALPPQASPPPAAAGASRGGGRRLLPILSLLVIGWLVVVGFGADDGPNSDPAPGVPAEPEPGDPAPADTELGEVSADRVTPFVVARDGVWVAELEVPTGRLVLDVRGTAGFDPVTTLQDAEGRDLAFNDDRSTEELETFGGGVLDSLIDVRVEAGRYRVLVEEWNGNPGDGVLLLPIVGG